jgi:GT2 family glycosyltransferase
MARGEMLAFVNPDTRAEPEWLAELVCPFVREPSVGFTTSKIVLMDRPEVINACGNDLTLTGIATCRRAGDVASTVAGDEEVAAVSGAACTIRADLFRRLRGFDERFWMYLEDTDLSWRVRLAGYRCLLAAGSVVTHHYRFNLPPDKARIIERNRYQMLAKNLSGWMLLALLPQLLIGELLTWGWAVLGGLRYLWAKALTMLWTFAGLRELWRIRRVTQALRRTPDRLVLRQHLSHPSRPLPAAWLAGLPRRCSCRSRW